MLAVDEAHACASTPVAVSTELMPLGYREPTSARPALGAQSGSVKYSLSCSLELGVFDLDPLNRLRTSSC